MRKILQSGLVLLLGCLLIQVSNAATYTVDRGGGDITDGAGNTGSFAYVISQVNNSMGPHTINFTFTGVIDHTGGPGGWQEPWNLVVNWNNPTAANLVTINGNGATLSMSNFPGTTPGYAVNALTISGSFVEINDLNFTGVRAGGAGAVIADPNSFATDPNPVIFTDITFNDCSFINNPGTGVFNSTYVPAAKVTSSGIENVFLNNCSATGNGLSGAQFSHATNVQFNGGSYTGNGNHGIFFTGQTYNHVVAAANAGLVPSSDLTNAIGVTGGNVLGADCSNNGTSGNGGGIVVEGNSSNIVIDGCTANNNVEHGLWLRLSSSNNQIINSTSSNNGGGTLACGINISLGGNTSNIIRDNNVSNNQDYGIYLYDNYGMPNDDNTIEGNEVNDNNNHGIYILNSTKTWVRDNSVYNNGLGTNGGDGINFGNSSSDGEISGNEVYGNSDNGINVTEGVLIPADASDANTQTINPGGSNNNDIFDNYVGIKKDGSVTPNGDNGIKILKSSDNQVGVSGRNYVSGNTNHGIYLDQIPTGTTSIIKDNFIGTDLNGTADEGNGMSGIFLSQCKNVQIEDNVISGNDRDGIELGDAVTNVAADIISIKNNMIGVDVTGTVMLPNEEHGVRVDNASYVHIGDGTVAGQNVISGNKKDGVHISSDASHVTIDNNFIGLDVNGVNDFGNGGSGINMTGANTNSILNNYVSGNGSHGIAVQSAATQSNVIQGNFVGIDVNSDVVANNGDGIYLLNCKSNFIGGVAGEGNVVSGNLGHGISLNGSDSDQNTIGDNKIGIDPTSNGYNLGNGKSGIYISNSATDNMIGFIAGQSIGNVIAGNGEYGIHVDGSSSNSIDGNIIGMNDALNTAYKNMLSGIYITGSTATGNEVGLIQKNTIAGDHEYQVIIDGGASNNKFQNNDLGLDGFEATSNAVLISGAGTTGNEIGLDHTNKNTIVHSSNSAVLLNSAASDNIVQGNLFIGSGGASPNSAILVDGANSNTIGGSATDRGNIIAKTAANAITVQGASDGNQIQYNYIGVDETETTQGPINGHGILLTGAGVQNTIINENVIGNIDGAANSAIYVDGVSAISTLYGNYVGITRGSVAVPNDGNGVSVINNSDEVTVGAAGQNPNVISNNALYGIEFTNATESGVVNSYIGTDVNGTSVHPNGLDGIHVGTGNDGMVIDGNVISGNNRNGILVDEVVGTTTVNEIKNNKIGLDQTGANTLKNGQGGTTGEQNGIKFTGSTGAFTVSSNEIGGHDGSGIYVESSANIDIVGNALGTNASSDAGLGNQQHGVHVTGGSNSDISISDNVISANGQHGVLIEGLSSNTTISGNAIGVNQGNTAVLGNTDAGVHLTNTDGTLVQNNVIGGNDIGIHADAATNINLDGNWVGTFNTFIDLGNLTGIALTNGSNDAIIGGNAVGFNYIGIQVQDSDGATIGNNKVGSDGTDTFGNDTDGIILGNANNTTINNGNIIGENGTNGIHLSQDVTDLTVQENTISNNTNSGILVEGTGNSDLIVNQGNTISGNTDGIHFNGEMTTATIAANTISGNTTNGIFVEATGTSDLTINAGNIIESNVNGINISAELSGTNAIDGNAIGASSAGNTNGILLENITSATTLAVTGNTIEHNTQYGVYILNASGQRIGVTTGNEINNNTTAGVAVDGSNDNQILSNNFSCNGDGIILLSGGNDMIADPVINSYQPALLLQDASNGGNSSLQVDLTNGLSLPFGGNYRVQVYQKDPTCPSCNSGTNQGTYLGEAIMGTGDSNNDGTADTDIAFYNFSSELPSSDCDGYVVVVTDMSTSGSSHFSDCSVCSCIAPVIAFTDANTPFYTDNTAGTHPFDRINFCEGASDAGYTFQPDNSINTSGDVWTYEWFELDTTAVDPTTFNPALVDMSNATSVQAASDVNFDFTPTAKSGYYFVLAAANNSCFVASELFRVQEFLNPTPDFTVADVCEGTTGEVYTNTSGIDFDAFKAAMGITTNHAWTVTLGTINGADNTSTLTVDYATAGSETITLVEDYDITTNTVTSSTATCTESASNTLDVNDVPVITNTVLTDEICSTESHSGLTVTADVASTTFDWTASGSSGNVTGFTASGTGNVPAEALSNSGSVAELVTYTITPTGPTPTSCVGVPVDFEVTVNAIPVAPTTAPVEYCVGDGTIAVTATGTGGTLKWYNNATGGVGNTTAFTPSSSVDGVTTYYVSETSAQDCESPRASLDVTVHALPTPTIDNLDALYCANSSSVVLSATPSGGTFSGNGISGNSFDPQDPSIAIGTSFTINYDVTDANGCQNDVDQEVTVTQVPNPLVDITYSPVCEDQDPITITANPTLDGSTAPVYTWTVDGVSQSGTSATLTLNQGQFSEGTLVEVEMAVTAGCTVTSPSDQDNIVGLYPSPIPDANQALVFCENETVSLSVEATNVVNVATYNWTFNGSAISGSSSITGTSNQEGTYSVQLISDRGCVSKTNKDITVEFIMPSVTATASASEIKAGESVTVTAQGSGDYDYTYEWYTNFISASNQFSTDQVATHTPANDVTYVVQANTIQTNSNGATCPAQAEVFVLVRERITIPNGFTPNNGDDLNDVWVIKNLTPEDYPEAEVKVFNRWGTLIWESEPGYATPWDGTSNGSPVPTATYYYVVDTKVDGEKYAGSVAVIR